jgi:hypothetical protein
MPEAVPAQEQRAMADEVKVIEVEGAAEVSLALHVGGSYSYKWQLFEYPAGGGEAKPTGGEQQGTAPIAIGRVARGVVRRFVWSVAVVSDDELEQTVDVAGHVLIASKTIGVVQGKLAVKKPLQKFFVNVQVKGKAT